MASRLWIVFRTKRHLVAWISRCGRTEPDPCSGSYDADVFRASEVQHPVQHLGGDGHFGEGFRTPANQAVVWHEAGVRKPPMHEPAGRGRCYGDLKNLLSRRGWRDDRCGRRGDPDVPPDGGVGRRDRSAGVPSTCRDDAGRPDLTVIRAVSDPVIAAGTPSPGGRSTATLLAGRG